MRARAWTVAVAVAVALAPALPGQADSTAGWYEVAFVQAVDEADRAAVAAAGGEILGYLPDHAYLAWFDSKPRVPRAQVSRRSADAKVHPYLRPTGAQRLVALVHRGAAAEARARFSDHGHVADVRPDPSSDAVAAVYLTADPGGARAIARDAAVAYIGPASSGLMPENEASAQIVAGNIEGGMIPPGYEDWLATVGVSGEGVRVTVVDSGVDPRHPDLADAVEGKVERSQLPTGEPMDGGGHGTHVAGAVAGRGLGVSEFGLGERARDADGYLYGLGVAPGAGIIDQNAISNTAATPLCGPFWPPSEWEPLTADALAAGSSIWNASWQSCEGTGVGYIQSTAEMDRLTRDGDSDTDGPQPFTMVFSAGNSGSGSNDQDTRLTAPKEAKNTIVVAASGTNRGGNIEAVSSFSSRGPARDGRWIPTVAAPGDSVLSTRSTTATASCSTPAATTSPDSLLYSSCSGTSMAAPHVTGAVALLTEWWRNRYGGTDPSPAMSKALLVNSAADMGPRDIPNRHEGWGRVDLGALFDDGVQRLYSDQEVLLDDVGDAHAVTVDAAGDRPLQVTLVWTDAPALPGAEPALVNDLDLVITAPDGTIYRGNVFAEGASVAGGDPDRINNVENVALDAAQAGSWQVDVIAHNLPADGDPFAGDATDQDFALVVSS